VHVAAKRKSISDTPETAIADLSLFVPAELRELGDAQTVIPRLAKDDQAVRLIEHAVQTIPTAHRLYLGDGRRMASVAPESVHLVLTSPPYWTLKEYRDNDSQLGHVEDYDEFLCELDKVWKHCFKALVPGGRLICVVGDVCLSRRENGGRHTVVPLHASIQEHCRKIGFDNLAPIIWHKISNAAYEVDGGSGFLGKPYEPNAVIKNDIEFILMERKPGGYRAPDAPTKILSLISAENHKKWFQQIWAGVTGASTKNHPAPYPVELAERLVRMFSFVGDTVLDPFLGTGTTTVAAAKWGRNSVGFEVDSHYFKLAQKRIAEETTSLFSTADISATVVE
jgi:DNA modification methylase